MDSNGCIIANISYGTGPYIRITELSIAINDYLEEQGLNRQQIVVPWIYGEKQDRILDEEFGDYRRDHPEELILDETLGDYCRKMFYENEPFKLYIDRWLESWRGWSEEINNYLQDTYGNRIRCELSRAPRIPYGIDTAYFTSFARMSRIYEQARNTPEIAIPDRLLREASSDYREIEAHYNTLFISEPGTFTSKSSEAELQKNPVKRVPPLSIPPETVPDLPEGGGIYVTVSGIPGLNSLYKKANKLGYQLYSNDPQTVPNAREAVPWVVASEEIEWHIARPGWGSIWLSIFTETPLLLPAYDSQDDPEMYHNTKRLEELEIGQVYEGQPFEELTEFKENAPHRMRELKADIERDHGTLDGINVVAKSISREVPKK